MINPKNTIKFVAAALIALPMLTTAAPLALEGESEEVTELLKQRRRAVESNGTFSRMIRERRAKAKAKGGDHDMVSEKIDMYLDELIKHDLDRDVSRLLREDRLAQQLDKQVEIIVGGFLNDYYRAHMTSAVPALNNDTNEYVDLRNMASFAGEVLGFSEEVYNNPSVFFVNSAQLNAYTWSGTPNAIQLAFFKGLLTDRFASPEVVLSIVGHEVGHTRARHIYNSVMLNIIFNTTGRILIPTLAAKKAGSEDAAKIREAELELEAIFKDNITRIMKTQAMCKACGHNHANETVADSVIDNMIKQANTLSTNLVAEYGKGKNRDKLFNLALQIAETISDNTDAAEDSRNRRSLRAMLQTGDGIIRSMDDEGEMDHESAEEEEIKPIKDFMRKMDKLSRSQEATSDRFGVLVAGVEASMKADGMLLGTASIETLEDQVAELVQIYNNNPDIVYNERWRENSHPDTVFRVAAYKMFAESYTYQIFSHDFLKGLFVYSMLVKDAEAAAATGKNERAELREGGVARENALALDAGAEAFEDGLYKKMAAEIDKVASLAKGKKPTAKQVEALTLAMDFMKHYQQNPAEGVNLALLGKEGRLMYRVVAHIDGKLSTEKQAHVKAALQEIKNAFSQYGVYTQPATSVAAPTFASKIGTAMAKALTDAGELEVDIDVDPSAAACKAVTK